MRLAAALAVLLTVLVAPAATSPAYAASSRCDVHVRPGDDVRRVVADAGRGATVCFGPGTYRLRRPIRPPAGQTLVGHDSVLTGDRVLRDWRRVRDGWVVTGQRQQGERTGSCARGEACTYPDDVLREGRPLRRVLDRDRLAPGRFWFDYRRDRIVVGGDPRGHRLEALVAWSGIVSRPRGHDVTVRGFTVEHFATRAQHGAIETFARGWRIEDNVVRRNHGAGITTNGHAEVVGNRVVRNGQLGIGGTGDDTLVARNTMIGNTTLGFDQGWEAGGGKWAFTDGLTLRGNRSMRNHGPGLWVDIDALDTAYVDNVVRDNDRAGIFHEISGDAVIRGNVVTGNGHGYDTWLWGAGILIAGSHDVEVVRNRLAGNAAGIALVQQDREESERDGSPRTLHDLDIHHNRVRMSGGPSGGVTDNGYDEMFDDPTITWRHNRWTGVRPWSFYWDDREMGLRGWHRLGHDPAS